MKIKEAFWEEIVQRILTITSPEKIILFGSAATGKMDVDSDIDLLIVEQKTDNRREQSVRIRSALNDLGYPFDVMVVSTDWFEASKNVVGGIAYPANKYGKVIYEAA